MTHDTALRLPPFRLAPDLGCRTSPPNRFFPASRQSTQPAKRVCNPCNHREACLRFALETDERFGIWGGLTPSERKPIRKRLVDAGALT